MGIPVKMGKDIVLEVMEWIGARADTKWKIDCNNNNNNNPI